MSNQETPKLRTHQVITAGFQTMDSRIDTDVAQDLGLTTPDSFDQHLESAAEGRRQLGLHEASYLGSLATTQSEAERLRAASQDENALRKGLAYGSEGYTPPTESERDGAHRGRALARQITATAKQSER